MSTPTSANDAGRGLLQERERIADRGQHLGARCTFTLDPDGGCVVHRDIPYDPAGTTSVPSPRADSRLAL